MVEMNDMMKVVLGEEKKTEIGLQLDALLREIASKTKIIKNCIIYDKDGSLEENKINFDRVLQFVGDWTGYEVSCNEIRFERKSIFENQLLALASRMSDILSQRFIEKKIVVYISLYENEIELRFHTYRENEGLWLDKDLNKYDVPILCLM